VRRSNKSVIASFFPAAESGFSADVTESDTSLRYTIAYDVALSDISRAATISRDKTAGAEFALDGVAGGEGGFQASELVLHGDGLRAGQDL
jgi:hypothetical protein